MGALEELKRRCKAAGLETEEGDEYSNSPFIIYPGENDTCDIEVWDEVEAQALLREPFDRYQGIDGFKASWSPSDGVIECNVVGVDPYTSELSPKRLSQLIKLGLDPNYDGRVDPGRRVEFESAAGLSVSIGPCSTVHGVLHYSPDFLDPDVDTDSYRPLTVRLEGAWVERHDDTVDLLERVGESALSRIGSDAGVPLALERTMRKGPPRGDRGRAVMFPPDTLLFWGRTVGVTGYGPYDELALKKIVTLEGGIVGDSDVWQTNQLIVVGRKAFDKDYLLKSVEFGLQQGFTCRYLAQEDFWHFWLGGEETMYFAGDPRIARHEGLAYIASIGFKWPSIEAVQGFGGVGDLSERLNATHLLKSRFGYSAAQGSVAEERRRKLSRAVTGPGALGLRAVAEHIAGLIRINRLRYDDRMLGAIERWESDLDWLYRSYYEGRPHSFLWPNSS